LSSALHHGPPGSFKTFTLVQRRAIPALADGRVVVTNIRGFESLELVIAAFPDIEFPNTAELIYCDTEIVHNRKMMAVWYLWVPFGAVILIDEVQRIYRSKDKVQDLTAENFPDFYTEPLINGRQRPDNFYDAFDMQRHFNWDVFMSSTNIAKVRSEIREVSEWAYRHRNVSGLLPWKKNCWYEHQHDPEQSGKIASHRVGVPIEYTADPRIFECYQSTATGDHLGSTAGRSIFSDPKIVGTFVSAVVLLLVSISLGFYQFGDKSKPKSEPEKTVVATAVVVPEAQVDSKMGSKSIVSVAVDVVGDGRSVDNGKKTAVATPLGDSRLVIDGHIVFVGTQRFYFRVVSANGATYRDNTDSLIRLGYKIFRVSDCMFVYVYNGVRQVATCA
jgi:zona occludens toxin